MGPVLVVAITPLNYYSSLVNSFSDAAGEDLCVYSRPGGCSRSLCIWMHGGLVVGGGIG